jgi:hypothetical protein
MRGYPMAYMVRTMTRGDKEAERKKVPNGSL